jgi:hypothetical protein
MDARNMTAPHDDSAGICLNCQLARVLTEWRDSGADATAVVDAIRDMVNGLVYAALDEVFEDVEQPPRPALDG